MPLRHLRRLLPLASAAALAALAAASPVRAQSLQDCTVNVPSPNAKLPIGYGPGPQETQLFDEKRSIRDYLASLTIDDLEFPGGGPLDFVNPVDQYALPGSASQNTGGFCLPGVASTPSLTATDELELDRFWLMWTQGLETGDMPPVAMLAQPGSDYLLSSMENLGPCQAWTPGFEWDPALTWLVDWAYPGNPYYTDPVARAALKRRGAAWLGLQLIMIDWENWGGHLPSAAQSPQGTQFVHPNQGAPAPAPANGALNAGAELAGPLGHMAYTFMKVQDVLPHATQDAMKTLLSMYAERVWWWTPYGGQLNLGVRSTWGTYLAYLATGDNTLRSYYQDLVDGFYGNQSGGRFFPAGYMLDDGRFDSGYNGVNALHALRNLQLDPNAGPEMVDATARLFDLSAHLTFHDPDGTWYSPNEFNTRSAKGAIGPVVAASSRDSYDGGLQKYLPAVKLGVPWAQAYMRDERDLGPENTATGLPNGPLDPRAPDYFQRLICLLSGATFWMNYAQQHVPSWAPARDVWTGIVDRSYATPLLALDQLTHQDLVDWRNAYDADPHARDFPIEQEGPYIHSLDDEFVFAKFGGPQQGGFSYATMIHAGPVSPADFNVGPGFNILPAGFGGGEVSMFWGPHTGAAVRGMRNGYNNLGADDWNQWRSWPMHAVSMINQTDDWTSSARIVAPSYDVSYYGQRFNPQSLGAEIDAAPCPGAPPLTPGVLPQWTNGQGGALGVGVRVCGAIPVGIRRFSLTPAQVLQSPMDYSRAMYADETGVYVRTTVTAHGGEALAEAWETIPIYDQHWAGVTPYAPAEIWLVDSQGGWQHVLWAGGPYPDVAEVYVTRADGAFRVVFDTPRPVAFADRWYKGDASSMNILVDLDAYALSSCDAGASCTASTTVGYRMEMRTDESGGTLPD